MTNKEKAQNLVQNFYDLPFIFSMEEAKQCALIALMVKHDGVMDILNELIDLCPADAEQAIYNESLERKNVSNEIHNL